VLKPLLVRFGQFARGVPLVDPVDMGRGQSDDSPERNLQTGQQR
jgi:hypothetical protein